MEQNCSKLNDTLENGLLAGLCLEEKDNFGIRTILPMQIYQIKKSTTQTEPISHSVYIDENTNKTYNYRSCFILGTVIDKKAYEGTIRITVDDGTGTITCILQTKVFRNIMNNKKKIDRCLKKVTSMCEGENLGRLNKNPGSKADTLLKGSLLLLNILDEELEQCPTFIDDFEYDNYILLIGNEFESTDDSVCIFVKTVRKIDLQDVPNQMKYMQELLKETFSPKVSKEENESVFHCHETNHESECDPESDTSDTYDTVPLKVNNSA